ncbi:MAG: type VI secretion system tube protein Hcp [Novosphingobium sp.]|nr:type VI secretion system tube protein Hcp [Novosphingobium sp.]
MYEFSKGEELVYDFKAACDGTHGDSVELEDYRYKDKTELALLKYIRGLEARIVKLEARLEWC